ncbi:MAG TPA: sugar porter family MFS transporter [Povalibacter sp.]|nr:sugar porter family MFS transporter [Povalibacter sp.]
MKQPILVASIASAALAGLLFGFDTAVISGVTSDVRTVFGLSPATLGITVSMALWGTLVGALTGGVIGDRYGSRDSLRLMAVLYFVSGIGCALAWSWASLLTFRFIGGLAIGGSSVLAPVYISEISPPRHRGMLVGLFQLNIVLGILVAYLSNFLIGQLLSGPMEWRWKLAITAGPAALLFVMLCYIPQSPRWLAAKGRVDEALGALRLIGIADAAGALQSMQQAQRPASTTARLSWHAHRKPILLAVGIAMFNQLAGINAILYYLNDIFAAAGFDKVSSDLKAVVIGATNLLFTLIAMACIDRIGRKRLLLIGAVGMAICLASVAAIMSTDQGRELLIWTLVGFIACFAFSQGAVIWVYISEIFPTPVRARGQSIGSSTHWIMNAIISALFPLIAAHSRALPFAFFAGMMVLQFVVVLRFFPETRGVPLEQMDEAVARA